MKTLPCLGALAVLLFVAPQTATGAEDHAKHMLLSYFALSESLFKDDLEGARKLAQAMVAHDPDSALAKPAKKLADSKSLKGARKAFVDLSEAAIKVREEPAIKMETFVMHCPMARNGKGADWLQQSKKTVKNPYMGSKMPHCGSLKKQENSK